MRFFEFNNIKPKKSLRAPQARIASLKRNAEIAKQALDSERKAQQMQKSQAAIRRLSAPKI